jgi:hypothetical protein
VTTPFHKRQRRFAVDAKTAILADLAEVMLEAEPVNLATARALA